MPPAAAAAQLKQQATRGTRTDTCTQEHIRRHALTPTHTTTHLHSFHGIGVCGALGTPPLRCVGAHLAAEGLQA